MIETEQAFSSFGALLKALRKRRRLTQQQLAQAIGVHRVAIIRWEQGDFLPESKTTVLELARQLYLSDQETRHLLEASLTALAPHWLVPFPRNPFFTGREEILEALHGQLTSQQAVALTQSSALSGLGGVGKTQIALEYAYRYGLEYSAVFWVASETEALVVTSLLRIGQVLQLPGYDDKDQQRGVEAVQRWLTMHGQWLLIWDNVEDLDLLERFLPARREGAILLTTRLQALGTFAVGIDLLQMEPQEGLRLLLRRAKVLGAEATEEQIEEFARQQPQQYEAARELVEEMAGLPLALDQAGAYLEETRCGLSAYCDLFHTQRTALLQQRGEGSRHHPASVFTTFTLAITATTQRHPAVGDLLRVCALLQPDAIPEELFLEGSIYLGPLLQAVCTDPLEWNRMVALACSYSLLSRNAEEQTLSLHRLVQAVLLDGLTEDERRRWGHRLVRATSALFPAKAIYTNWKWGERLLPHALLWLSRLAEEKKPTPAVFQLLSRTGTYLRERGHYRKAKLLLKHALAIAEQRWGTEHPDTAASLNNLALLYCQQGQYERSEPLHRRALAIRERQLGSEHPDTAASLNGLASLYYQQGKYTQAEPLYLQALAIQEQQLGAEHPDTAASLSNLALLYYQQGQYEQAEPLYQQALRIWEQVLGSEHLITTHALQGLAMLRRDQGNEDTEAEHLFVRTLTIREHMLVETHPDLAETWHEFAILRQQQGRWEEAESFFRRALEARSHTLGGEHSDTRATRHRLVALLQDLALLRQQQGKQDEALFLTAEARQLDT